MAYLRHSFNEKHLSLPTDVQKSIEQIESQAHSLIRQAAHNFL